MRWLFSTSLFIFQLSSGLPASEDASFIGPRATSAAQTAANRAAKIKNAFEFAWNGYYTYAFPNDELTPGQSSRGDFRP